MRTFLAHFARVPANKYAFNTNEGVSVGDEIVTDTNNARLIVDEVCDTEYSYYNKQYEELTTLQVEGSLPIKTVTIVKRNGIEL